jgi:hypothetical protein
MRSIRPQLPRPRTGCPKAACTPNGNGFVPPVRKDIYEQLSATIADATRTAGPEAGSPGLPANWDEIAPGY